MPILCGATQPKTKSKVILRKRVKECKFEVSSVNQPEQYYARVDIQIKVRKALSRKTGPTCKAINFNIEKDYILSTTALVEDLEKRNSIDFILSVQPIPVLDQVTTHLNTLKTTSSQIKLEIIRKEKSVSTRVLKSKRCVDWTEKNEIFSIFAGKQSENIIQSRLTSTSSKHFQQKLEFLNCSTLLHSPPVLSFHTQIIPAYQKQLGEPLLHGKLTCDFSSDRLNQIVPTEQHFDFIVGTIKTILCTYSVEVECLVIQYNSVEILKKLSVSFCKNIFSRRLCEVIIDFVESALTNISFCSKLEKYKHYQEKSALIFEPETISFKRQVLRRETLYCLYSCEAEKRKRLRKSGIILNNIK